jgi:hypothetical protein
MPQTTDLAKHKVPIWQATNYLSSKTQTTDLAGHKLLIWQEKLLILQETNN